MPPNDCLAGKQGQIILHYKFVVITIDQYYHYHFCEINELQAASKKD